MPKQFLEALLALAVTSGMSEDAQLEPGKWRGVCGSGQKNREQVLPVPTRHSYL